MTDKNAYIFGRNAVIEALSNPDRVSKVFVSFGVQGGVIDKIYKTSKERKIPISRTDTRKFRELERKVLPKGAKSQGVIALLNIVETIDLNTLLDFSLNHTKFPILVALDEISDPHNLGAIARSAECSGALGLIIPERNSAPITPVAVKSSAGALEHINISMVGNLSQALQQAKDVGFWIVGTDTESDTVYTADIYDKPIVLIIGSEGKGIRPGIMKHCDHIVRIPMAGQIESLNASVSAGIVLFEILRQRSSN